MTVQFRGMVLQILSSDDHLPLPKPYVTHRQWLDGTIHLFWRESELQWRHASDQQSRKKPRQIGKAETFEHPWYNKPVGKIKTLRKSKR
jgi:hypothetical protein